MEITEKNKWEIDPREFLKSIDPSNVDELKRIYRKVAWLYHPDKNLEDVKKAEEYFKGVSALYSELTGQPSIVFKDGKAEFQCGEHIRFKEGGLISSKGTNYEIQLGFGYWTMGDDQVDQCYYEYPFEIDLKSIRKVMGKKDWTVVLENKRRKVYSRERDYGLEIRQDYIEQSHSKFSKDEYFTILHYLGVLIGESIENRLK